MRAEQPPQHLQTVTTGPETLPASEVTTLSLGHMIEDRDFVRLTREAWGNRSIPRGIWFTWADNGVSYGDGDGTEPRGDLPMPAVQSRRITNAILDGEIITESNDPRLASKRDPRSPLSRQDARLIADQVVNREALRAGTFYKHNELLCWYGLDGLTVGPDLPSARKSLADAGLEEIKEESKKPSTHFRPPGLVPVISSGEVHPKWKDAVDHWTNLEPDKTEVISAATGTVVLAEALQSSIDPATSLFPTPDADPTQVFIFTPAERRIGEKAQGYKSANGEFPSDLTDWDHLFRE